MQEELNAWRQAKNTARKHPSVLNAIALQVAERDINIARNSQIKLIEETQ